MDYMQLDGFMGKILSRFVNKGIESKFGIQGAMSINELNVKSAPSVLGEDDGIEVSMKVKISKEAFQTIVEEVTR